MRLIDCFIESLAYTIEIVNKPDADVDDVRSHLIDKIDSLYGLAVQGGYSENQYRLALFATVAFVDEKLVSSVWNGQKQWARQLLQRHYFDTSNAGVEFFEKLDRLNPFNCLL